MPVIYCTNDIPDSNSVQESEARDHTLGRTLLLHGLKNLYHMNYSMDDLQKALSVSPAGKPALSDYPHIHFNISHCEGLVACAFFSRPVGIDAELPGPFEDILIKKVFSPEEKYFFYKISTDKSRIPWFYRFWTLKEAYVKKQGTGIRSPLTECSFTFSGTHIPYSVICSDPDTACWQHSLTSGHILSLCYESRDDETVSLNFV